MILKSYTFTNQRTIQLHYEIKNANVVQDFEGIEADSQIHILGNAIIDEAALDLIVANHVPRNIPTEITPRQARQALLIAGISEQMIVDAINTLPSPTKEMALIEWEYSVAFLRYNPLVATMAQMLGWNTQQLDDLWILGATL